jgi:uncharacterized RDD family membrane protein YckC
MQLTFVDPPPQEEVNPLGTVRMNLAEMARIQAAGPAPAPEPPPVAPVAAPAAPTPTAPMAVPAPPPAPEPRMPQPAGGFSQPVNPAPAFLQGLLPPIPDDAQPVLAFGRVERGDFGTRFLAWLIDWAVAIIFSIVMKVVITIIAIATMGCGCVLYLFVGLAYLFFQMWCLVKFRATIGKKVMKLRVVPEGDPAGNLDWGMAVLRMVGYFVDGLLFCLPYLLILGSERKGFQDMFSGSIVIKVDR